jgi:hypothetical protein
MKKIRVFVAIGVGLMFLSAAPVVWGADTPQLPEKSPGTAKTPETSIDPGIQKDPGPSPDPRAAVPPKNNPDPGMAINPEVSPRLRSQTNPEQKELDRPAGVEKKTADATTSLKGQVLKIEQDAVTVSTAGGGQARLKLDPQTKMQGAPKVGDKVEVELTSDKQVVSLKITE